MARLPSGEETAERTLSQSDSIPSRHSPASPPPSGATMYDRLLALISWVEPAKSGTAAAFGIALFVARAQGVTLLSVILQVLLAALVGSGAVQAHNSLMGGKLPALTVPLPSAVIERACAVAAVRGTAALTTTNVLLSWADPINSVRALAYLTLGIKAAALVNSKNFLALWCLAFVAGPALSAARGPLERWSAAFAVQARPMYAAVQGQVHSVQSWAAVKPSLAQVVLTSVALGLAYFAWPILSLKGTALGTYVPLCRPPRRALHPHRLPPFDLSGRCDIRVLRLLQPRPRILSLPTHAR
jgi:hypothetical protein